MKKISFRKIEAAVFAAVGVLMAAVLIVSAFTHSSVRESRPEGDYAIVEGVSCERIEKEDAPTGVVNEYRFTLHEIGRADTLAFFINHHNVEVYLDEECVYDLTASDGPVRTPGGIWVTVPLYEEDAGKEVRVALTPLYSDYQDETPDFELGSELAIYRTHLYRALPELVLSLCVVLAGLFLLCMAIYHSVKRDTVFRLYALGTLAISAGVWRFTYGNFSYMLLANHEVIVYNLSIVSLMFVALSMLHSVELAEDKKGGEGNRLLFHCLLHCLYCAVCASARRCLRFAGNAEDYPYYNYHQCSSHLF